MARYEIPAGTRCHVRRGKVGSWRPYRTTRDLTFFSHGWADHGSGWTFRSGEWELKVASNFVRGASAQLEREASIRRGRPSFSGTTKGRGSSRRRTLRANRSR